MFFRTQQIKGTQLLQLVEAYRNTEGQPRQRVVASLGNDTLPAGDPRRLAKAVEDQINGQADWLDKSITEATAAWVVQVAKLAKRSKGATAPVSGTVIDGVLPDEMETGEIVELGPQLVAMKAWDALDFTPMLHNLGMNPTAMATAQVMVAIRRLLRTHSVTTTRLPLEDGRVIEVRKPSRPDAEQALVYQRLGIDWKKACPVRKFVMK